MKRFDLSLAAFVASGLFFVFLYGVVVGTYRLFPFDVMNSGKDAVFSVFEERDTLLGVRPVEFLQPARYRGSGVTKWQREGAVPGLTLLTGFFDGENEIRLVRLDGTVVRRWAARFFDLFPDPQHVQPVADIPKSEWNVALHGSLILPDGSVVFNFDGYGTVKIDRCSAVQWTVPSMTHHSVFRSADGGFWVPGRRLVTEPDRYPRMRLPYYEDLVLKISSDGKVVKELSVLEMLYRNGLDGFVYRNPRMTLNPPPATIDVTHLNDVEELTPDVAAHLPQFAAGDLMLSLRFEHLVMVVDPETLRIKWYQGGPWHGQHDPDFTDTGTISVFSNNSDGTPAGRLFGGSTILEIDPRNRAVQRVYGHAPGQLMFTQDLGKHQVLGGGGGHVLVTEARAGRVFEADRDGRLYWEYVNRYDDEEVALVSGARRYPESYFTVADWSCPAESAAAR